MGCSVVGARSGDKGRRLQTRCDAIRGEEKPVTELHPLHLSARSVRADQPLIAIPFEDDGVEMVRHFSIEQEADQAVPALVTEDSLGLIGASADLDWEEMERSLDRIR